MRNRKTIYLILFFSTVSLSAQNFILNAKYNRSFNSRIDSKFNIEGLLSINNRFDIGLFVGAANVEVNEINQSTHKVSKGIYGITSYFYPFNKMDYPKFLSILFFSLKIAKVSDRTLTMEGSGLPSDNERHSINNENDKLFALSVGIKADLDFVNILCEIGYQHRTYNITYTLFEEEGERGQFNKLISKSEDSIFIEIGLQFVL